MTAQTTYNNFKTYYDISELKQGATRKTYTEFSSF